MDWRERYERAAARYAGGETREPDERQLVQLANAAWAAGLSLLMAGDREAAREWLVRSAEHYRESWDAGRAIDAWGRPIGAIKALLIAGEPLPCNHLLLAARWALDMGAAEAESPIGRYAGAMAQLVLERDAEAAVLASGLGEEFPADVAAALTALATGKGDAFRAAVAAIRQDFESRDDFLEDVPVSDTALALEALATRRGIRA